jgi:hypothetical protein
MSHRVEELPECIREALAAHEGFRRIGFSPDNIYCVLAQSPSKNLPPSVVIVIKTPKGEFTTSVGVWTRSRREFQESWVAAANNWNTVYTDAELDEIWQGSRMREMGAAVIQALQARGMLPEKLKDQLDPKELN